MKPIPSLFTASSSLSQVTVEVADENGDAGASIIVGGYSLSGSVITDGQPTSGVNFVLHAQDNLVAQPGEASIMLHHVRLVTHDSLPL